MAASRLSPDRTTIDLRGIRDGYYPTPENVDQFWANLIRCADEVGSGDTVRVSDVIRIVNDERNENSLGLSDSESEEIYRAFMDIDRYVDTLPTWVAVTNRHDG